MRACLLLPVAVLACGQSTDPDTAADAASGAGADAASGPDAGPGSATDPADPGPFLVGTSTSSVATSLGTAQVTLYAPEGAGPFPLLVVSTGFQIGRGNYAGTCEHVASWGYLVLAHDYTAGNHQEKAAEVSELIDWALESDAPVDPARIATAGHSLGGKVSVLAAIEDERVGAVVGWDPVDALPPFSDGSISVTPERMDELDAPIALIGETGDGQCAPPADNYQAFFAAACGAPDALEVTIAGADHTDWVDDPSACGFACLVCQQGTTADATVRAITRRVTVAWLEIHLRGRTDLGGWISEPGAGDPATVRSCR